MRFPASLVVLGVRGGGLCSPLCLAMSFSSFTVARYSDQWRNNGYCTVSDGLQVLSCRHPAPPFSGALASLEVYEARMREMER